MYINKKRKQENSLPQVCYFVAVSPQGARHGSVTSLELVSRCTKDELKERKVDWRNPCRSEEGRQMKDG